MEYSAHKFQEKKKKFQSKMALRDLLAGKLHFQLQPSPFPQVLVCVVFSQPDLWFEFQKVFLDALVLP